MHDMRFSRIRYRYFGRLTLHLVINQCVMPLRFSRYRWFIKRRLATLGRLEYQRACATGKSAHPTSVEPFVGKINGPSRYGLWFPGLRVQGYFQVSALIGLYGEYESSRIGFCGEFAGPSVAIHCQKTFDSRAVSPYGVRHLNSTRHQSVNFGSLCG